MSTLIRKCALYACVLLYFTAAASAQATAVYQPSPAAPPSGSGYLLPDGSIRITGSAQMEGVIGKLNDLYTQLHPGTKFTYIKANDLASTHSLEFDATAFAPITTYFGGSLTYADIARGPAFSIRMAHASLAPQTRLSPYVVIVNPANPVTHLSVSDLSSIFTQPMRQRVYSHWDQVGQKGALAGKQIATAGLPWSDHYPSEDPNFGDEVFNRKLGGQPPVDTYHGFKTYAEVGQFVAATPAAIGITTANQVPAGVKVIGVVETVFGKPQTASPAEIAAGHYPLDRYLYINAHAVTGKPLDPFVLEYLRMVLSPQGQQVIAAESSGYIPLNDTERQEELAKFD